MGESEGIEAGLGGAMQARGAEIGEEAAGDTDAVGCSSSRPVFPSGLQVP